MKLYWNEWIAQKKKKSWITPPKIKKEENYRNENQPLIKNENIEPLKSGFANYFWCHNTLYHCPSDKGKVYCDYLMIKNCFVLCSSHADIIFSIWVACRVLYSKRVLADGRSQRLLSTSTCFLMLGFCQNGCISKPLSSLCFVVQICYVSNSSGFQIFLLDVGFFRLWIGHGIWWFIALAIMLFLLP